MNDHTERSLLFKALSDPNRIRIVDMLSCGELCACTILGLSASLSPLFLII